MANKYMAKTYFRVRSTSDKQTTFSLPAHKKGDGHQEITIPGMAPKPNPKQQAPVYAYLNEQEKSALGKEKSFEFFCEKGVYVVQDCPFETLPTNKQEEYDPDAYKALVDKKAQRKIAESEG